MAPAPSSQWSGLGHMVAEDIPDAEFGVEGSGVTTRLLARLPLHSLSPLSQYDRLQGDKKVFSH